MVGSREKHALGHAMLDRDPTADVLDTIDLFIFQIIMNFYVFFIKYFANRKTARMTCGLNHRCSP